MSSQWLRTSPRRPTDESRTTACISKDTLPRTCSPPRETANRRRIQHHFRDWFHMEWHRRGAGDLEETLAVIQDWPRIIGHYNRRSTLHSQNDAVSVVFYSYADLVHWGLHTSQCFESPLSTRGYGMPSSRPSNQTTCFSHDNAYIGVFSPINHRD